MWYVYKYLYPPPPLRQSVALPPHSPPPRGVRVEPRRSVHRLDGRSVDGKRGTGGTGRRENASAARVAAMSGLHLLLETVREEGGGGSYGHRIRTSRRRFLR